MKRTLFLISMAAVLSGCQTTTVAPDPSILRVGVTPRSQPMIYKQNGQIMGIEADFAQKLGAALNRKVVFIEVPWQKQIDYLEQNKTDIIMSNMSITRARSMRVNFTAPYLQSGLSVAFRRDNYDPSSMIASTIRNQSKRIGFVEDTTGEYYCMQRFSRAERIQYPSAEAAGKALKEHKIDMFIHDAPVIWWLTAVNEANLVSFQEVMNVESIAWAVAKNNMALLGEANSLLKQWDTDGTSANIIRNWISTFQN